MELRIALLNAAHNGESSRRNFRRELDAAVVEYDATDGDLPGGYPDESGDFSMDAVVITGSRASVYWDEPWIDPLIDYVGAAAERDVPILGVCFGHQVLAEALGGRADGMGEFEIGYRTVRRRGSDPLFEGVDDEFTVFTTHGDAVVELPPGAALLAENDYGVHAFRKGDAWGVQFHPEYDTRTARRVSDGKRDRLGDDRVDAVLEGITEENYAAACEAKRLFDNFTAEVRRIRASEPAAAD